MSKHIEYLLKAEETMNIRFNRSERGTLVLSSFGYIHQDLMDVEEALLKMGCRYDFGHPIQEFDKVSGRTFTHMREPKERAE